MRVSDVLPTRLRKTVAYQIDKMVLYSMNRRVPDSLEESYEDALPFEKVLDQTRVNMQKTAVYQLLAPGEHPVWLDTPEGQVCCHVRVRLAADPTAPLLLYHHGFNELPYYSSWRRVFPAAAPFSAHSVCIQAPFHDNWFDPMAKGFQSLQNIYQIFAGSLRLMELVQNQFEAQGAAYTVLAGVSWGGITSLLYEGIFQQSQAVIPMLSSPNLAQVIWDIADLFDRPTGISRAELYEKLDFTPYYERCEADLVYPLLGEDDLFFRLEAHSDVFDDQSLVTIPQGHIASFWGISPLRQHILQVLEQLDTD